MDCISTGDFARGNDVDDVEVAVSGRWWADADAFVCEFDMHGLGICGGMHSHRLNSQLLAGTQNTKGNFASVCDQNLRKHEFPLVFRAV